MSESTNELSRIVSLIMQNPQLISEISSLAKREPDVPVESTAPSESTSAESVKVAADVPSIASRRNARSQLLCALKPYVSKERAGAIDSMISIAEILEVMKAR